MKTFRLNFTREFISGPLKGNLHHDSITFPNRWNAAQWVKGVRQNTRRGKLEYKLVEIKAANEDVERNCTYQPNRKLQPSIMSKMNRKLRFQ